MFDYYANVNSSGQRPAEKKSEWEYKNKKIFRNDIEYIVGEKLGSGFGGQVCRLHSSDKTKKSKVLKTGICLADEWAVSKNFECKEIGLQIPYKGFINFMLVGALYDGDLKNLLMQLDPARRNLAALQLIIGMNNFHKKYFRVIKDVSMENILIRVGKDLKTFRCDFSDLALSQTYDLRKSMDDIVKMLKILRNISPTDPEVVALIFELENKWNSSDITDCLLSVAEKAEKLMKEIESQS